MKTLGDVQAIVVNEAFKSFEEFRKEKMKFIQQANETNTIEGILDLFYFTNYAEGSRMLEGVNAKILKELSEFLGIELKKDSYRIYGRLNNGLTKVIINSESKKYYVERDFYGAEMWHKNEIKKSRRWLSRVKAFRRLYERAKNKKTIKNLIILARAASTDRELHFWLMLKMWGRLYKKNYEHAMAEFIEYITTVKKMTAILIPQVTATDLKDDDREPEKRVYNQLSKTAQKNTLLIEDEIHHSEIKHIYSLLDYLIGTRFHSVIFALTSFIPAIAIEYEYKTRGILKDLDLSSWHLSIEEVQTDKVIALFDKLISERNSYRKHLEKVIPAYIRKARNDKAHINRVIDSQ